MSVCAVEIVDGLTSVGEVFVVYERSTRRATGAVVAYGDGVDGADASKQILVGGQRRLERSKGRRSTSRSSSASS